MCKQPDYFVNGEPEGSPQDTDRCQYRFEHGYSDQGYHVEPGMRCGLPVVGYDRDPEPRCYFHSERQRKSDVRPRLEAVAKEGAYLGEAQLAEAPLQGTALEKVIMPYANLKGAHLEDAHLIQSDLRGAKLGSAQLQRAELCGAKLHGTFFHANLQGANLQWAVLGELLDGTVTDLQTADLREATLAGARIPPTVVLYDVTWGTKDETGQLRTEYYLQDERNLRRGTRLKENTNTMKQNLEHLTNTYHELRIACRRSALQEEESAFFVREKDCQRAILDREIGVHHCWERRLGLSLASPVLALLALVTLLQWRWPVMRLNALGWWLLYYLAGYLEMPGRVLAWLAGIWGVSIVLLQQWGSAYDRTMSWGDAVYASTANLTSLNLVGVNYFYPHFTPSGVFNAVASVESVSGIILAALLVACLVRKFGR